MLSEVAQRQVRLWHKRISLALLVWIFFVAASGMILNHGNSLGIDRARIANSLLLKLYGIHLPPLQSLAIGNHYATLVGGDRLFIDNEAVTDCQSLSGAARLGDEFWVGCSDKLLVIQGGELVEVMTPAFGLPSPITALGQCEETICLNSNGTIYLLDKADFNWAPAQQQTTLTSPVLVTTPRPLAQTLSAYHAPAELTWERFIRDLHSGVFFRLGPWLMDIFAIALMALSLTGLVIWLNSRKRRNR